MTGNILGAVQASLDWPALPFWQGLQDEPGNLREFPFGLTMHPDGFLVQAPQGNAVEEVIANYAKPDYGFITPPPGTSNWGTELGEAKLRTLEKFAGALDGLRILEIGGGNLFLASSLCRKYTVSRYVAIDPAIRKWPENTCVEVLHAYFPCAELAGERFDLVLAHNCLEHIPDTVGFLSAIRAILAPEGRAFLTFPDVSRQFADGDLNAIVHEHLAYLDESTARILFARTGFSVAQWESSADLASCLLARAEPEDGQSIDAIAVAAMLFARGVEGYYVRLPRKVNRLVSDLEAGRTVAFYGATNGLNSLLAIADIGRDLVVMDGDKAKHGRFLPACRHPVQWVGDAQPKQFERIYVTAGSFQLAIMRALSETYEVPPERIIGLFRHKEALHYPPQ